jgi:hypothetical protein
MKVYLDFQNLHTTNQSALVPVLPLSARRKELYAPAKLALTQHSTLVCTCITFWPTFFHDIAAFAPAIEE